MNAIGEGELSLEVSSFAQSLPGKPEAPQRVASEQTSLTEASITLEWTPLTDTGGVPLTGYQLYAIDSSDASMSLLYDGTDFPEVVQVTVLALSIDTDYSFYVTGLNPFEGEASEATTYRLGGRPDAPSSITEVSDSRTGNRIGLEWSAPTDDGGSAVLAYTLVIVRENMEDVVLYYGSETSAVMNDLTPGNKYSYRVKATNAVGDGEWSPISTFLIAEAPSPPINLVMTAFDNTFVFF